MIEFRKPELKDADWIREVLKNSGYMTSEACFGNLYMWCDAYDCDIANVDGLLVTRTGDSYTYPVGKGCPASVVLQLETEALLNGADRLKFHCIDDNLKAAMEAKFPNAFEFEESRDNFDYIYSVEKMANLSGKKYHGKRNHISYFENNFDWSYEEMNKDNIQECLDFSGYWNITNAEKIETGTDKELEAIHKVLAHFDELGLVGGILRVQGDVVAYTFGEPISDGLFCTHVEKAAADIRGAYPMINREFARNTINKYEYVNREEDLGIEGLRRAKESYYPEILLKKYTVIKK